MDFATFVTALSAFATLVFAAMQYWFNKEVHKQNSSKYTPKIVTVKPNPRDPRKPEERISYLIIDCHCPVDCTINEVRLLKKTRVFGKFTSWEKIKINYFLGLPIFENKSKKFSANDNGRPFTGSGDIQISVQQSEHHFPTGITLKLLVISNEGIAESIEGIFSENTENN